MKKEYGKIVNISGVDSIAPVVRFVGVQVERDRGKRTLTIHQTRYIEQVEIEYKGKIKQQGTPFGESKEQRSAFDKLVDRLHDDSSPPVEQTAYLSLMGKLVWPSSMTRPDIAMVVSVRRGGETAEYRRSLTSPDAFPLMRWPLVDAVCCD